MRVHSTFVFDFIVVVTAGVQFRGCDLGIALFVVGGCLLLLLCLACWVLLLVVRCRVLWLIAVGCYLLLFVVDVDGVCDL